MSSARRPLSGVILVGLLMAACAPAAPALEEPAAEEPAAEEWSQTSYSREEQSPDTPVDNMYFEDYGRHPFVVTSEDALSTFAVDVDTGSYTLTRSYLDDHLLPPPEAIRVEEFVNSFEQEYPLPTMGETFDISLEAASTPFTIAPNYVLRVGLQGYDVDPQDRPDATLIFVVDISGSMQGPERLGAVQSALLTLVHELRQSDKVGIVVYGSHARVLLEPTEVTSGQQITYAINQLHTEGATNAEDGLRRAYELATTHYDSERINRIILCSDGVANIGNTGPDAILRTVRQQAQSGIALTTVGFGMGNYNDVLMEQLANDGDGQYFYVDTEDEAKRVFVEDLTGTLFTIARDAKVQVEFSTETVASYRLIGYENRDLADEDFRNDTVDAGEIGSGHSVTALYEIAPVAGTAGVVASVHLRWEDPNSGETREIEQSLYSQDIQQDFATASPTFQLDSAVAAFADLLSQGAWAQTANFDTVIDALNRLPNEVQNVDQLQELIEMVKTAEALSH